MPEAADERLPGATWESFNTTRTRGERPRGWASTPPRRGSMKARRMEEAQAVIEAYNAQGIRPPVRSVAYRVCANLGLAHDQVDNVEDDVTDLRRARRVDMDAVDNLRTEEVRPWVPDDAAAAGRSLKATLRTAQVDRQQGQPCHGLVLAEASGMIPFLSDICEEFGWPLLSGSGSVPISTCHEIAEAAAQWWRDWVPTVVLCVTDFDLAGIRNIFIPFARDVEAFAAAEVQRQGVEDLIEKAVYVRRIAATAEQVAAVVPENLRQPPPPNCLWWPAEFSLPTAEALLDILPGIVRDAITTVQPDDGPREAARSTEAVLHADTLDWLRGHLDDD